jgi:hypothetical protein
VRLDLELVALRTRVRSSAERLADAPLKDDDGKRHRGSENRRRKKPGDESGTPLSRSRRPLAHRRSYVEVVGAIPAHRPAATAGGRGRTAPLRFALAAGLLFLAATVAFVPRLRRPSGERPTWRLAAWLVLLFLSACLLGFIWRQR